MRRLARTVLGLLIAVALTGVIVRATFRGDAARRLDPLHSSLIATLGLEDPRAAERPAALARFDAPYAAHPVATYLHLVAGAILMLLLPVQLSASLRARRPALHRWSGRLAVAAGLILTLSALYFGLLMPFAGPAELVIIVFVCVWFVIATVRAIVAIRRNDRATHREWMLRAMAVPVGVAVIRVVGLVIDPVLVPFGISPTIVFALTLWIGWPLTIAGTEAWVRHTRPHHIRANEKASRLHVA